MRLLSFVLSAALLGLLFPLLAEDLGTDSSRLLAIKDARLVLEPGKEIAKGTLLIRDGRIELLGTEVPIPAGAKVIVGEGLVVYPGFIDAANSWGVNLELRRSEGGPPEPLDAITSALAATPMDNRKGITPEFTVATALQPSDGTPEAWRKQGVVAYVAFPEGGLFGGQSALVATHGRTPRRSVLKPVVAAHASFQPPAGSGYPFTLMGSIAHVRQTLLDAGYHARLKQRFDRSADVPRPANDPALDELNQILIGVRRLVVEAESKDEIHRALDFWSEYGVRPTIFGGAEAWKCVDRLKAENITVLAKLTFPDQVRPPSPRRRSFGAFAPPPGEGEDDSRGGMPDRVKQEQERKLKEEIRNVMVLAERGVPVALSGHGLAADKFMTNLRRLIKEGWSSEAALRALTLEPARWLGVENQLGRIAVGRPANLVAFTAAFDQEKAKVRLVVVDGVTFEYEVQPEPAKPTEAKPATAPPEGAKPAAKPAPEKKEETKPAAPQQATELEEDRRAKRRTGGNVLVRGGTLVTVTNGTRKADLLIQNGKIAKIGDALAAPHGTTVVQADGWFIMPGIVDTHCHFAAAGGLNEASLSVVPEVRVRDVIASEDVQIYRALAGGVTTARLLHGSANCIGGQDAVIKLRYGEPAARLLVADAPRGVKFALGENVKRSEGRFPNTRLGVEAVFVRCFAEAQTYRQRWQEYEAARRRGDAAAVEPRRDLRLEALADILDGKLHIHCHSYRADEILMLLRVADRFGFKVKSLQHGLEGYKVAPEIAKHGASLSSFADWWAYKIEAFDAIPHNVALLTEAGVAAVLKSDSNELMRHLYQEAAKMMKYGGMTEDAALKTITLHAAQQLGLQDRIGSLEVGKDGDVAIFNGHPLDSYARCEMTLVDGEIYFERTDAGRRALPPFTLPGPRVPEVGQRTIAKNPSGVYWIKNVRVHPVTGPSLDKGSVVVANGRIERVLSADELADFSPPRGATEIDGQGLHLYPGMIDTGTILGLTELGSARETQDFAEGGDFQPDLRASIGINPDSELIPVTRANGVLTVVSRPTGAVIPGQSTLINLLGWTPPEMVVRDPLALQIDFPGRPFFNFNPNGPPLGRAIARKQRDEKLKRLRDLFTQAKAYGQGRKADVQQTPFNPRLEALLPYLAGEKPVMLQANRADDIVEALKLTDELKLKTILTGAIEAWKVTEEIKKRDVPVIIGPVMLMPHELYDPYDAPFACAARVHAAGLKFCIRSDGGTNSRNLPYEAAMAVSYGLPPEEGLKAVTLYPAQILGVANELGSIAAGKRANLVLTDGDILQATTQVHALFIDGVPVDPSNKQTKLFERYRERLKQMQR